MMTSGLRADNPRIVVIFLSRKLLLCVMLVVCFLFCILPDYVQSAVIQEAESERLISMDFRDTEIRDILRLLAKQNDLNLIVSEEVSGPITVQFSNVTVDEALDAIVTVNGFAYTRKGRIIKVTTPEEAEREPPVTQIFRLRNADVTVLKDSLAKVLSETGTIEADARSNSLIVTDTSSVISTIERLVAQLDAETAQVRIEARVVETTLGDTENLGIKWTNIATMTGSNRPITWPFNQEDPGFMSSYYATGDPTETEPAFSESSPTGFPMALSDVTGEDALYTFGTLDFTQYKAVLEVLYSRADTSTLANPTIITLDNQPAKISVARSEPIPGSFERNDTTGNFEITSIDEKQIGVILLVTPHVNVEGTITLDLVPEVSSLIETKSIENIEYPVTSIRTVATKVQITDGDTVVIGGLINENDTENEYKVPILGDIPILGFLFKKKEKTVSKSDLLIFITAHILDGKTHRKFTDEAILSTKSPEYFPEYEKLQKKEVMQKMPKPLKAFMRQKKNMVIEK